MFFSFLCKTKSQIFIPSKCLTLSQNLNVVVIRYVSAIPNNEPSFTVSYLINSCGLSLKSALSVSKKIQIDSPERSDSVISFFKNHGFSQTQIKELIRKRPSLLLSNPEKTFLPKFQFFYSRGISSSKLATILSSGPSILTCNLHKSIIPNFNSFKNFTQCDDNRVFRTYNHCTSILSRNFESVTAPNRAILKDYGVPESTIMNVVVSYPRVFIVNHDRFKRAVEEVKNLGIDPLKVNFVVAVRALLQISNSTWERKCNAYKQWGWSDEDIISAFGKYPNCMAYSEHNITAKMNYFVNTMGLKSSYIANHPSFLAYSLERRIIPRWSVLQALLSKGLIERINLSLLFVYTEEKFLETFVTPYKDPYILKLYKKKLGI